MTINFKDWQKKLQEERLDETPTTKAKAPYRPGSVDPATGKTREAPKGTMAYDKAQREKNKVKTEEVKLTLEDFTIEEIEEYMMSEDFEQLDELGQETLDSYVNEAKMTDAEVSKREKIVKGMKKSYKDFVSKYGSRAKDVMYATATKRAMGEETEIEEERGDEYGWDVKEPKEKPKASSRKVAGKAYGGAAQKDDDDEDDKKPEQPVKRGRGRPAGAKSGARQQNNGKKTYGGLTIHSLSLPNRNK